MNDELKKKLSGLGLNEEQIGKLEAEGAKDEAGMTNLSGDDIKSITGAGLVTARQVAAAFAPAPVTASAAMSTDALNMVLPAVPDDESFLKALRTGGVLKVGESTVIGAVRAALASSVGLYGVPQKLVDAMELYADETEEQLDSNFFELRKQITRADYGDLFSAIPGLDGNFVSKKRKQELLGRIDETLWASVTGFNEQLKTWQDAWMKGAANPMMLMGAFMGGSGALPPGLMQPPETSSLRDAAEAVTDDINKIFRGTGVQISAALAFEAKRIKETLTDPKLPAMIGAPNREQMLKKLGVSIPATYPRLETNLTQFVLGIMHAPEQAAGAEELKYFSALFMLGSQISWDLLGRKVIPMQAGLGRLSSSGRHRVGSDQ